MSTGRREATGERSARGLRVSLETSPEPADSQVVLDGLRAFNVRVIGPPNIEEVAVFVRDQDGTIYGGLLGEIKWRWLYIAKLWLSDELRGQRLGTRMMERAEDHAWRAGCLGIHLSTFEYQALPFYEKLGYEVFGVLEGYPPGYRQFYLRKERPGGQGEAAED
jgi:GNAT superfamily N-acetyltransferase